MLDRTDAMGRWESEDGSHWVLIEPAPNWPPPEPDPQTPRETLVTYLDQMTDEQAAPVLAVLGWIATLDQHQAATLTATLATIMQGETP